MMNNSVPTSPTEWLQHWQKQGFPWRTEPAIDAKRQEALTNRRNGGTIDPYLTQFSFVSERGISPIEKRYPPFSAMKLSRADVEWLLATHESGGIRGPVEWSDERQRTREGLDLRGADLRGVDLRHLPLSHLLGGERPPWEGQALPEDIEDLPLGTQVQNHVRNLAHLEEARLSGAFLERANLSGADLQGADLSGARLQGANLSGARLEEATLKGVRLQGLDLSGVDLQGANLSGADLQGADLSRASLGRTVLDYITLVDNNHVSPQVADILWGETNLTVVDWSQIAILGDEHRARAHQKQKSKRTKKETSQLLDGYKKAARANRQLAVVLQDQGLDEDAARFAYRAQILQRKVLKFQVREGQIRQLGAFLFSCFLALLTGYGYRMWHIIVAYLILILTFSFVYWGVGIQHPGDISFWQALIVSVTAFHGRVFTNPFTSNVPDTQSAITAIEAVVGLIVEGVFIAMLVQRFFGK